MQAHRGAVELDGTTKFERNKDERICGRCAQCAVVCGQNSPGAATRQPTPTQAPQYSHRSAVLPAPCCWVGVLQTHKQLQGEAGGSMDLTALKTNKAMSALM
jgi:hypothetical protein